MITKEKILTSQTQWSKGILKISSSRDDIKLYEKHALEFLNHLYGFNEGPVLFKPTKASYEQFRLTTEKALSYFVAGKNKSCKEDHGFALHPWKQIQFDNVKYMIEDTIAIVMGNYYFTDLKEIQLKAEYTFGYKLINSKLKIFLHHSSLPYKEEVE